jgi:hypothetical protein
MTGLSEADIALVDAYLKIPAAGDDSFHWAYEDVCDILSKDPEHAWRLTLAMIDRADDPLTLAYVAAGPLEDLLAWHGAAFVDRVVSLASTDPRFREALGSVWGHKRFAAHIYERVQVAIGQRE